MLTVREIKDGFQLVFPKEVMGQLGFKDKDKVEFEIKEDGIFLKAKHPQANQVGEAAFQNDTLEEIKRKMQKRVGLTKDEMEIAAQAGLIRRDQFSYWTAEIQERLKGAEEDFEAGRTTRVKNVEELSAYIEG